MIDDRGSHKNTKANGLVQGDKVLKLSKVTASTSFREVHCLPSDNNHSEDNIHKLQNQQKFVSFLEWEEAARGSLN